MKFISNLGQCSLEGIMPNRKTLLRYLLCLLPCFGQLNGQELQQDSFTPSILPVSLEEVILISSYKKYLEHESHHKPLSTLDEYLESSKKVNLVKRGAYAWEPILNDMGTERLAVTIDGMRIFGACTDRMDPITSYVDVSNLSDVHVTGGQQGAKQGATIGGAIDLRLEKSNFRPLDWTASIETGFESNNMAQIVGGELNYSNEQFYLDTDIIYRKADNYVDGNGEEIAYSQFEKYNLSANAGYKVAEGKQLLASFIFDEARDVGYPALPMDVSLARAFIGSVSWEQSNFIGDFEQWETKLYANSITHVMDDSQRPDVPIRMDMPGWSDTYGFFSQAQLKLDEHTLLLKVDGFYNRSLAEMTMYPNDPNQQEMFMLTWPDVRTLNTGLYGEDKIEIGSGTLKLSARATVQGFNIADSFGLNSLRIFYPEMEQRQTRFLKSVAAQYHKKFKTVHFTGGLSYGDRAPTVSEGFGFYLFNSFDNHDYIGNPDLKNEKALEAKLKLSVPLEKLSLGLDANYFHTMDYIIGEVSPNLDVMTIGAEGVKVYNNLDYATLYNLGLDASYEFSPDLDLSGMVTYHRGKDQDNRNLPFISPLSYSAQLQYGKGSFSGSVGMKGAADQVNFNPEFGEDRTTAYTVFSASVGKTFSIQKDKMLVKAGVENVFDTFYSTYTDWNNIPRMGRNFYMTVSYAIN
ncbi:TonB-dependent receptor [Flagellimonas sp.]|uniref:TonB-dependent receptor n=1 Tax=Flagellimonas sp. TaxID=2058762 RepID=UPI003B523327